MRELVSHLYAGVFHFLRESMLWYKAKRLKRLGKSFDQNFYDKFSDSLDNINKRAEQIHIRGNIGHHAKATDIIHTTRNIDEKLDRIITTQEEDRRIFQGLQSFYSPSYISALPLSKMTIEGGTEIQGQSCHLLCLNVFSHSADPEDSARRPDTEMLSPPTGSKATIAWRRRIISSRLFKG